MAWGCYKHEWNISSEDCQAHLCKLVAREKIKGFPTWGKDGQICPACYEELEANCEALKAERDRLARKCRRFELEKQDIFDRLDASIGEREGGLYSAVARALDHEYDKGYRNRLREERKEP